MSNTNVTNELTKLMVSQQAFGASSRLLQSAVEAEKKLMG
jgi:flagellar basal body rod protein FlgG